MQIAFLGRQPELGLAELESLLGSDPIRPMEGYAFIDNDVTSYFERLGGTIKLAEVIHESSNRDWFAIEKELFKVVAERVSSQGEKFTFGISVYGLKVSLKQIERTALTLKKKLRNEGRSVRVVTSKDLQLSSAQVLHNQLTTQSGWEINVVVTAKATYVARTVASQNIDAYSARDQARPKRDARVGMLPPKLAQIIINLASGKMKSDDAVLLDPFCGTGVVLQEASLMGFDVYGTDIEPRMVEYSIANMHWARDTLGSNSYARIEHGDATSHTWKQPVSVVACEGYLGLPFAHLPSDTQLQESIQTSNRIASGFLKNLSAQTQTGFRACIALPAWHLKSTVKHLPCLEKLPEMGWKRIEFKHASRSGLLYHRDQQIVGRELLVIERLS